MDDRYDPNLILGYVENELIDADRARVDAMLAEDEALAGLVADLQRDRAALRSAAAVEPKADLAAGAIAALERQMLFSETPDPPSRNGAPPSRFRLGSLLTYGGIAAVLALTVTVVFQSLQSDDGSPMGSIAMDDSARPGAAGGNLAQAPIEAQRRTAAQRETVALSDAAPDKLERGLRQKTVGRSTAGTKEYFEAKPQPRATAEAEAMFAADAVDDRPVAAEMAAIEPALPATSPAVLSPPAASGTRAEGKAMAELTTAPSAPAPAAQAPARTNRTDALGPEPTTLAESAELALAADAPARLGGDAAGVGGQAFADKNQPIDADALADLSPAVDPNEVSPTPAVRTTLVVSTPSTERTRRQLDAWAATHRVAMRDVTSANPSIPADGLLKSGEDSSAAAAEKDVARADEVGKKWRVPASRQQVVLLVSEPHVADLVAAMSADPAAQVRRVDAQGSAFLSVAEFNNTDRRDTKTQIEPLFFRWMNWRGTPNPVAVEVVIEESFGAVPAGPLRLDVAE